MFKITNMAMTRIG